MSVEIFPLWKNVLKTFQSHGFEDGQLIPKAWFVQRFGIMFPDDDNCLNKSPSQILALKNKADLEFLNAFEQLRNALLVEQKIDLQNVHSKGYRIVPSTEQTITAYDDGIADLHKALRKMGKRLVNTNLAKLDSAQQTENALAIARLGAISSMETHAKVLKIELDDAVEKAFDAN